MNDKPLAGHIAVVTGASRRQGIGAAICLALADVGADIFFTVWQPYDASTPWGADPDGPRALLAELRAREIYANLAEIDLSLPTAPRTLFDAVEEWLGAATILVNNAAVSTDSDWLTLDAPTLDMHYAVNVRATALLSVEFARRFSRGEGGRIINLTSGQSLGPMPSELAYAASKGAIEALIVSLAPDLMTRGITINAVNPGPTDTGWMDDDVRRYLRQRFPAKRIGQPQDVARLVRLLALPDAGWVTGQVIHSEGGFVRG